MEYLIWLGSVFLFSIGTYFALTRVPSYSYASWVRKHPWSTGVFFWGLAVLSVVYGLDYKGVI